MFSVILPTFNRLKLTERAIESVQRQTWSDWELIIVDDGSTDLTSRTIAQYSETDDRIKYFKLTKNRGVSFARNHGIKYASRDYICFLDSDDEWHPNKLMLQKKCLDDDQSIDFIFTGINQKKISSKSIVYNGEVSYKSLLKFNFIPLSTVCLHRKLILGSSFKNIKHEDYSLWLDIFIKHPSSKVIPMPLVDYNMHGSNLTKNKLKSIMWTFMVYYDHRGLFFALIRFPLFIFYRTFEHLKRIRVL